MNAISVITDTIYSRIKSYVTILQYTLNLAKKFLPSRIGGSLSDDYRI